MQHVSMPPSPALSSRPELASPTLLRQPGTPPLPSGAPPRVPSLRNTPKKLAPLEHAPHQSCEGSVLPAAPPPPEESVFALMRAYLKKNRKKATELYQCVPRCRCEPQH
jgi:hypothetical protein